MIQTETRIIEDGEVSALPTVKGREGRSVTVRANLMAGQVATLIPAGDESINFGKKKFLELINTDQFVLDPDESKMSWVLIR